MSVKCGVSRSTNSDGERRYLYFTPGVMDLLLISLEPLDLYETASTADQRGRKISPDKVKAQKVALGLLVTHNSTNNNSGASRTSQVMVPVSAWQILKDNCQHISTNAVRVKGSQQMGKMYDENNHTCRYLRQSLFIHQQHNNFFHCY